jgi:hypothetical protein
MHANVVALLVFGAVTYSTIARLPLISKESVKNTDALLVYARAFF